MSKNNNLQQQEKLIAVVLLETYSENFKPFSLKRAECLLPLFGGKTLLDNNIEYLIDNNVEEIYLFCTNHHQQIKAHIDERKWKKKVEIHFLFNFKCQSFGDAMREIDAKNLVSSNFILVTATAVLSNVKLSEHLELHKQVSKLDKNAVMTMICQDRLTDLSYEFTQNDASSSINQTNTLIVHNNSNRILHYENLCTVGDKQVKYLKLPAEMFQNAYHSSKQLFGGITRQDKPSLSNKIGVQSLNSNFSLDSIQHLKQIQHRNDLIDSQVYLCSPYVLHMFTDNFDYDTMLDFIKGVLVEEEVAGYTVYIDTLNKKSGSFFSSISNLNSYYFQSLNLIKRIELILYATELADYKRVIDKCDSYVSRKSVKLGKNVKIERNVLIDSNCKIGDDCQLVNCLIGSNCTIGSGVNLSNCIVWPDAQIGNNSVINAVFLGFNVKIGHNCNICENCLFSSDCQVKDNTQITKRGVFVPSRILKETNKVEETLSVNEDNYSKYFLKSDAANVDDDDDEFDTDNEDAEADYDAESVASGNDKNAADLLNDTEKNNHFFVWKLKTFRSLKSKLLRKNEDDGSGNESDGRESVYSETSSEDYDLDHDDSDGYADHHDDDKDKKSNLKAAASTESLKSSHQNEEDSVIFFNETTEILMRGLKENLNLENVILEINSCKHAHDIQIDDLCYYLVKTMFNLPLVANNTVPFDYLTVVKTYIQKAFNYLFKNYYTKTKQSQKIFLNALLDFFVEAKPLNDNVNLLDTVYVKLVHYLYDDEKIGFLSDELILEWYDAKVKDQKTSLKQKEALKKLEKFIEWLEEESDDEEDDDE